MFRVKKLSIYSSMVAIVLMIGAFFAFATPTVPTSKAYALNTSSNLLGKQSTLVNNVILFAFKDDIDGVINNGVYTQDTLNFVNEFNELVNESANSLQKYYYAISNGKLTINSNLVMDNNGTPANTSDDKPFVVLLDKTKAECDDDLTYGPEVGLIKQILRKTQAGNTTLITDSSIDSNNDNFADIFTFIYLDFETQKAITGKSSNTANNLYINKYSDKMAWPHRSSFSSSDLSYYMTVGTSNYMVNQYLVMSTINVKAETTSTSYNNYLTSTIIHEMGHALSLPDMYTTDNNSLNYVGTFDIMATNYKQSMCAYSKWLLGWADMTEITESGTYTLAPSNINEVNTKNGIPLNTSAVTAFYIQDPNYPNQKIVFEYRDLTNTKSFDNNINGLQFVGDQKALSSGLVIYRVNENYSQVNGHLIINSNKENLASFYYFRNSEGLSDTAALQDGSLIPFHKGDTFGLREAEGSRSSQSNINTQYISFSSGTAESPKYTNSDLMVEVLSMDPTNGLQFKVVGGSLTTGLEDEIYASKLLEDENLLNALSEIAGKSAEELTINDLETYQVLDLSNKGITDLSGLSLFKLPALKTLILNSNAITSGLEEISAFTSITNLQMADCTLTDISFIGSLANLTYVNFSLNKITNFAQLNPKAKPKLIFANIVLNNLDVSSENNKFLTSGSYDSIFAVGIQNFPSQQTSLTPATVYYRSSGLPTSVVLTLTNNSLVCTLEEGENILGDGHYTLTYTFNDSSIGSSVSKTIVIDIIVVTVKEPIVELLVGDIYQNDTNASFNGWKSTYSYTATITYNDTPVTYVDTSVTGTYLITFVVKINANTQITLTKKVIIYDSERVAFGEGGIKDINLYKQLLAKVGKSPTVEGNTEVVGTTMDNSLLTQDLYFYDIDGKGDEIIELDFANKKITDLTGINLLNLRKISIINLNGNQIADISPLFVNGNEGLPQLEELHLANMGLTELPETIGGMYSLKKIDLSFNQLTRVDALKPLAVPALLEEQGKEQMLKLVNLNMNNLSFDSTYIGEDTTVTFADCNKFVLDKTETAGYKTGDQIFIVMIQQLLNYSSYINGPLFDYYHTSANTIEKKGKTEYIFNIKLNGTAVNEAWSKQTPKDYCKQASAYTVSFSINGTDPFALSVTGQQFRKKFFVTTVNLKTLEEINQKEFTLEDIWKIAQNRYNITSTETIKHPSKDDLKIQTAIRNAAYENTYSATYIRYYSNNRIETVNVDLNDPTVYSRLVKDYSSFTITISYDIKIGGVEDGIKLITNKYSELKYYVTIHRNTEVTLEDENLDAKMREVLKKKADDKFYSYDTYKLTTLNLSNSGISTLTNTRGWNGFTSFHFNNLNTLNLSKNKLTQLSLSGVSLPSLTYLDVSFNSLVNSAELKNISTNATALYILASNNLYNFNADSLQYGEYAQSNMWLITNGGTYNKTHVIAGIQGINTTSATFVSYVKDIISCEGSTAGFYYIPTTLFSAKGFSAEGTSNDVNPQYPTYHYNSYYYYKEAGNYTISFNFAFANFNFNFQCTVSHGKAYVDDNKSVYIVDYDKDNTQKTIDDALAYDCLIYENCKAEDFTRTYSIYKQETIVDTLKIDDLYTYTQSITVKHTATNVRGFHTKTIRVLDRVAPIITMDTTQKYVQTLINTPYSWSQSGGLDRDVSATDNYDDESNITLKAVVVREGEETPLDSVFVPLDQAGIYTITFTATDSSGNVSNEIVRKVRVYYADYSIVKLSKPSARLYVGDSTFSVTVYKLPNRDPNPTFNWYVDGVFVKSTTMDMDSYNSEVAITSTVELPFATAGKHVVSVKINELESEEFVVVAQTSETEYFILLDEEVSYTLMYIAIGAIVVTVAIVIAIRISRKKKAKKISEYEYNLISKQ